MIKSSFEISYYQQEEDSKMGCNQSLVLQANRNTQGAKQYASISPITFQEGAFDRQVIMNPHSMASKQLGTNVADVSTMSKENSLMSIDDEQNSGSIKVKKAKRYKVRPEHERFIENILESNRTKAMTEFPATLNKSAFAPIKLPSLSLHNKPQQSTALNKENMEGHKQKLHTQMINSPAQGKYSKKEAQKLINNILQGKLNQQEMNLIGERIDLQQLDSNATLRL